MSCIPAVDINVDIIVMNIIYYLGTISLRVETFTFGDKRNHNVFSHQK